jgi:hypothetical protein
MNNYDHLDALMKKADEIEDGLKRMRDTVALETKPAIGCIQTMRDGLWLVDKALEKEYGGG